MSSVRRLLPYLLALVLGVAVAVAAGCGGSNAHLIPADAAASLKDRIAAVQDAINAGDCPRAEAEAARARATGRLLPSPPIDRRLKARINQGLRALQDRVPTACAAAQTQTTTTPTTTETTPTTTTPTTTTPTTTTPTTPTTPTTTTPTTPTTTPTTPTTGTTPTDSGGTGAPAP